MDMWTIRSADRLRCPRVAAQHGDCSPSTTCPQGQQQPKRFKIGFTKAVNSCVTSTGQVNLPSTCRAKPPDGGNLAALKRPMVAATSRPVVLDEIALPSRFP